MAQRVEGLSVSVSLHDHHSHAGNCTGLPANTGLFLSTGNRYLFLLQHQLFPFDSLPRLQILFSHAWRQCFVNGVSDSYIFHHGFQLLIVGNRCLLMNLHVVQFQYGFELRGRILNLSRLSKTSSDGIFDIDSRTSSHFVSDS